MSKRAWSSLVVIVAASAIRFPHYDIAWFGIDQVYFLSEARRILSGARDVVGPLSSGLNLLGPLYSYLLAGLLWIRNDAAFLGAFNAACEVAGTWFLFDAARRLTGTAPALAGAFCYIVSPALALSTRLIWNPSLLPMMVAIGWWTAVRYAEAPSTGRLVGAALCAGLMLPLHPTGLFPALGVALAVALARFPTLPQLAVGIIAGLLPIVPTLVRMRASTGDVNALGSQLVVEPGFLSTIPSVLSLLLAFPTRLFGEDPSARFATLSLYTLAIAAGIGAIRGIAVAGRFQRLWIAFTLSCVGYLAAASLYSGAITWYYLLALVPPFCLFTASAVETIPAKMRAVAAAVAISAAVPQLIFVQRIDRHAVETGMLQIDAAKVFLRRPPGEAFSFTMRKVREISQALAARGLDGPTAMATVHGLPGEIWRESGAEFMPWAEAPRTPLPAGVAIVEGGRVCEAPVDAGIRWRAAHRATAGWETADFAEEGWFDLPLPQRTPGPSLAGDDPRFSTWRSGRLVLRGKLTTSSPAARHLLAVTVHGPPLNVVAGTELFVNGVPLAPVRQRAMYAIYRNEEWLIDLSGRLHAGENIIALGFAAPQPVFDLDVFELPCTDSEWYH